MKLDETCRGEAIIVPIGLQQYWQSACRSLYRVTGQLRALWAQPLGESPLRDLLCGYVVFHENGLSLQNKLVKSPQRAPKAFNPVSTF